MTLNPPAPNPNVLDNAVWAALSGPQASFAEVFGRARRFPTDISPFSAIENSSDPECWSDLANLIGPGGTTVLTGKEIDVPKDWEELGGGTSYEPAGMD